MNFGHTLPDSLDGRLHYIISARDKTIPGQKRSHPGAGDGHGAISTGVADSFSKGFIFIPDDQHSSNSLEGSLADCLLEISRPSGGVGFPIVIPYPLLLAACHAVSTNAIVRISQYSLICYGYDGWGTLIFNSRCGERDNVRMKSVLAEFGGNCIIAIELHVDGLIILQSQNNEEYAASLRKTTNQVPIMTLEDLAQKEAANQSDGMKRTIGKDPINVIGTVDAISPILFNDSQDEPFAIMELYQPPKDGEIANVKSAVVVIRGDEALSMHHAIHPGQSITLIGVVSRKWRVPDEFQTTRNPDIAKSTTPNLHQRLSRRIPDRVILVSEAKGILVDRKHEVGRLDIALPSTVDSLTSIRGVVKSVHFHHSRSKEGRKMRYTVNFVTMLLMSQTLEGARNEIVLGQEMNAENGVVDNPKMACIYLPKYSMSPNLNLGLQPGSILRAVNIHSISPPKTGTRCEHVAQVDAHFESYVACLRSTLAVECCAGETRLKSAESRPWFVPKGTAFSLVPEHRITEISSDPINSRSIQQLFAEENLRRELDRRISMESLDLREKSQRPINEENHIPVRHSSNSFSARANLDALLDHYRQISISETGNNGKGVFNECPCMKRSCQQVHGKKNGRLSMRNPYAEFFDHAHNFCINNATECGSSYNDFSSFKCLHHVETTSTPRVVELKHLRNACAQNFINRVAIALRSKSQSGSSSNNVSRTQQNMSRLTPGWSSCYQFQGLHLCQVLNDYARIVDLRYTARLDLSTDSSSELFVWGTLEGTDSSFFSDRTCVVPISKMQDLRSMGDKIQESQLHIIGSPSWVHIGIIFVSCLCLGSVQNNHDVESSDLSQNEVNGNNRSSGQKEYPHRFLPSMRDNCEAVKTDGHVFVFLVDNHIFIASVHIAGKPILSRDRNKALQINDNPQTKFPAIISVKECLERTTSDALIEKQVRGRLVRQRFAFRRMRPIEGNDGQLKKCFEGWSFVMSHIDPSAEDIVDVASTLQAIEVKMSVEFSDSTILSAHALSVAVRKLREYNPIRITPDQASLGTAWWIVSGNSRSASLLFGGLGILPSVYVEIPFTSCTVSNLGYRRFQCNLNEINSFFVYEHESFRVYSSENLHEVEFNGFFLQGMLTRRLRRAPPPLEANRHGITRPSLLTKLKRDGGIPSATLAELHWDICSSLNGRDNIYLKPSLLRHIPNTKIIGISFCRARVECTKCFQVLTGGTSRNNSHPPMVRERCIGTGTIDNPPKLPLTCPSGCSRSHANVKWECSATIDDGTGQAKLYAERESALLLLGSLAVEEIEKGAWESENGVFFQPSLPISSRLQQCLKDASISARRSHINMVKKNVNQSEFLTSCISLLPTDAKAEYLLHQHCRHWYQHNYARKIDLLCRCKPLSEDVSSVNQTDIQVAKAWTSSVGLDFGNAPTSTLPPLKLVLEDACHASDSDDNVAGWHQLERHIHLSRAHN